MRWLLLTSHPVPPKIARYKKEVIWYNNFWRRKVATRKNKMMMMAMMFCIGIGGKRMVMMIWEHGHEKDDDEEVDAMMFCIGIGGRGAGCIWVDWDALCCQLVLSCTAMHTLHTLQLFALRCTLCYKLHLLLQLALRCTLSCTAMLTLHTLSTTICTAMHTFL